MSEALSMDQAVAAIVAIESPATTTNINKTVETKQAEAAAEESQEDFQADPADDLGELEDDNEDALDENLASGDVDGDDEEDGEALDESLASFEAPEFWDEKDTEDFKTLPKAAQEKVLKYAAKDRSYISAKKEELSVATKRTDGIAQALLDMRSGVDQAIASAEATFVNKWANVDWKHYLRVNPVAAAADLEVFEQHQESMRKLQEAKAAQEVVSLQGYYAAQHAKMAQLAESDAAARQLADPVHGVERKKQTASYLKSMGISDADLEQISAEALVVAYKASRWDASQKKLSTDKTETPAKPKSAQTQAKMRNSSVPSQTQTSTRAQKQERRFAQTNSLEDALAVYLARSSKS